MASTNRTFDAAIWFAPADLAFARDSGRNLNRCKLRVKLIARGASLETKDDIGRSFQAPSRVKLVVISGRSASFWLEDPQLLDTLQLDPAIVIVLGPGLRAGDATRLQRLVHRRLWDMRSAWGHDGVWSRLGRFLVDRGNALETAIEPRFSLMAPNLQRNTIHSYNEIAEEFSEQWFDHPPHRELELFLQKLSPKSCVLDSGCGPGHHARILSNAGHDVVGVDLSDGMLEQARKRVRTVRLKKMDIRALTFGAGCFDAIWCAATILHVPREHIVEVFQGFRRILKPGGILGVNLQVGRPSELVQRQLDHRFFEYYAHAGEILQLLGVAGFTVESSVYGETKRNTHQLDIILKWSTVYARRDSLPNLSNAFLASQDRET